MTERGIGQEPSATIEAKESQGLLDAYFDTARKLFGSLHFPNDAPVRRYFSLCGKTIELVFANEKLLASITPALEHLTAFAVENPALKIYIWDDETTGTVMPAPPWAGYGVQKQDGRLEGVYTRRGDVRGFQSSRIKAAYNWSANALSMYDASEAQALYWTRDARALPAYETSAPLRNILNWWAQEFDYHFVHGAAVGTERGGVILAGKGGSGKSTAALACLSSGLLYASDDYCLVGDNPNPAVYSLFSSAKLDPGNFFRMDHIAPARVRNGNPHDDKDVFFLYPQFAGQITSAFPLRAILLPRITGRRDSGLSPASWIDGVKALTISTMCQFPGTGKKAVEMIKRLAEALPCYHLDFGTDLAQVPTLILHLLEKSKDE